jgi:hypothetical protein
LFGRFSILCSSILQSNRSTLPPPMLVLLLLLLLLLLPLITMVFGRPRILCS